MSMEEDSRQKVLSEFKYYKGEDKSPYEGRGIGESQNKDMLWFYEKYWINANNNGTTSMLEEYVSDYIRKGLADVRSDLPLSLRALLFNRFMRDSFDGNTEPFKSFLDKYY